MFSEDKLETGKEAYISLLKSFNKYFLYQSRILLKEIKTIKYATNYYRKFELYYYDKKQIDLNLELSELEIIYDGIKYLEEKVDALIAQFKKENKIEKKSDGYFIETINKIDFSTNNYHISILPMIDSKIKDFQALFVELNFYKESYFNIIDSKEFPTVITPKFNKRFRNANKGFFLNKELNENEKHSYKTLIKNFYEENGFANKDSIKEFDNTQFFAKWSHSTNHYIKSFNSPSNLIDKAKNIYISMSYVYLDKTIFHSIAFHEISHAMKHEKLRLEDSAYLEESIAFFNGKSIFKQKDPFDSLYKEILCDLSAIYASGSSYIISLMHIAFFELKDLFFELKDFNPSDNIVNKPEENFQTPKNEDLIPKNFDFNINNIELSVRLLILIRLSEELEIKNTYINGIKFMLEIIFPPIEEKENKNGINFLTMYEFIFDEASDYQQTRYLIYSLYEKFQSIILNRKLIKKFKSRKENTMFSDFKNEINKHRNHNSATECKLLSMPHEVNSLSKCKSIYDLLWFYRENDDYNIREKEINRLYNIYCVFYDNIKNTTADSKINVIFTNILKDFYNGKKLFYYFEFIKYKSTKSFHPLLEYLDSSVYTIEDEDKIINDKKEKTMSYIFAPYDIAILKETDVNLNSVFKDYPFRFSKELKNKDNNFEKNKYFVDRHSLFLLNTIEGNKKEERLFATITQIKLDNTFSQDDYSLFKNLIEYIEKNKDLFTKCRIFKSMGAEDYLLYTQGLSLIDTKHFGKNLITKKSDEYNFTGISFEVEDLILLETNNKNIISEELEKCKNDIEIITFSKINCDYKKEISIPDKQAIFSIKKPTNRFDSIINWKVNKDTLSFIEEHLKSSYFDEKPLYNDFDIEIMYKEKF